MCAYFFLIGITCITNSTYQLRKFKMAALISLEYSQLPPKLHCYLN
jgi:hypothetical protein